jgi:hypothetical protein
MTHVVRGRPSACGSYRQGRRTLPPLRPTARGFPYVIPPRAASSGRGAIQSPPDINMEPRYLFIIAAAEVTSILLWLAVLLTAVIAGTLVILRLRRSMMRGGTGDQAAGFGLHDLQRLHAAGELSDEEYERAKSSLLREMPLRASPEESDSMPD